jgi:hypothetical protein
MVKVAQGNYILVPAVAEIALAHSSDTNSGDSQLITRGLVAGTSENKTRHNYRCRKAGGKHGSPGYFISCVVSRILRLNGFDFFIR